MHGLRIRRGARPVNIAARRGAAHHPGGRGSSRSSKATFVDKRSLWRIHFDAYPKGSFSSEVFMLSCRSINSHSEHDLFIRLFLTNAGGW